MKIDLITSQNNHIEKYKVKKKKNNIEIIPNSAKKNFNLEIDNEFPLIFAYIKNIHGKSAYLCTKFSFKKNWLYI